MINLFVKNSMYIWNEASNQYDRHMWFQLHKFSFAFRFNILKSYFLKIRKTQHLCKGTESHYLMMFPTVLFFNFLSCVLKGIRLIHKKLISLVENKKSKHPWCVSESWGDMFYINLSATYLVLLRLAH